MENKDEVEEYIKSMGMFPHGSTMGSTLSFINKKSKIGVEVDQKKWVATGFSIVEGDRDYNNLPDEMAVFVAACNKMIAGDAPEQESEPEAIDAELIEPVKKKVDSVKETKETTAVSTLPSIDGCDIVRPMVSALQAKEVWDEFQALKLAIIEPSDLQNISGKSFVKKSGWRKLANVFNLSDEIIEEVREEINDSKEWIWTIKVRTIAPNRRSCVGVAKCSSAEKSGARKEHDTYTTAHTRAKNRAISDLIAAGEVSAEEMK